MMYIPEPDWLEALSLLWVGMTRLRMFRTLDHMDLFLELLSVQAEDTMMKYCDECGLPKAQCICDESEPYEGACPNCGAVWGMEELDWNRCAVCGWPDNDDIYEYPDYGDHPFNKREQS